MLREKETVKQTEYKVVMIEELVPEDHLLRKVEKAVDFSFIHDLCKDLYSPDNGRPAIEPELLFRMLFLGYLYGIKSEVKALFFSLFLLSLNIKPLLLSDYRGLWMVWGGRKAAFFVFICYRLFDPPPCQIHDGRSVPGPLREP